MNWPSLSIIIPSFNQGAYIERTILSILKQEYKGELEVIVSDGGSKDETVEVLQKYPQITWWSKPDKGFVDAVRKGFAVAKGEILAIQSSDDFYLKNAFEVCIKELVNNEKLGIVTGCDVLVQPDLKTFFTSNLDSGEITPRSLLLDRCIPQHCAFFRRDVLEKIGGLREEVDTCADMDFWYRALHFYKAKFVPFYTAAYQRHANQRTKVLDNWSKSFFEMVEFCESDPFYNEHFKLSEEDKRNWYAHCEIFWQLNSGKQFEDKSLILQKINTVLEDDGYTYETKKAVHRTGVSHGLISDNTQKIKFTDYAMNSFTNGSLLKKTRKKFYQVVGNLASHSIDIDWWKK